jgi:SAM-dependent methyltransferase
VAAASQHGEDARRRLIAHYDAVYATGDYFGQESRLYRAFMHALVQKGAVRRGSRLLDAGCGQGHLSRFLAECGLRVWCTDLSSAGLRSLDRYDGVFRGKRVVADLMHPAFASEFDVVFQRSCSLLNGPETSSHSAVVERLTDCARVGGLLCVVYNSNLSGRGDTWFNHTVKTLRGAFGSARLSNVKIYVVNKLDCLFLGRYSFNQPLTFLNILLSKFTIRGFEIVVFARRRQ